MARLIDANELMEQIRYYDKREQNELWETPDIEYVVAEQPTVDAVEVVRCKDCQYAKLPYTPELQKLFRRCNIHGVEVPVSNNHFCACGERRTDNG